MSADTDAVLVYNDPAHPENVARTVAVDTEIIDLLAARDAPPPVSFSDAQIAAIFAAARSSVPRHRRTDFLEGIARRVPSLPSDADVRHAVAAALSR